MMALKVGLYMQFDQALALLRATLMIRQESGLKRNKVLHILLLEVVRVENST